MHHCHELAERQGGGGSVMGSGLVQEVVGVASHQRAEEEAEDSMYSSAEEVLLMKIATCIKQIVVLLQKFRQEKDDTNIRNLYYNNVVIQRLKEGDFNMIIYYVIRYLN